MMLLQSKDFPQRNSTERWNKQDTEKRSNITLYISRYNMRATMSVVTHQIHFTPDMLLLCCTHSHWLYVVKTCC